MTWWAGSRSADRDYLSERGLTLLEVTIVISIIALLLGMGVSFLQRSNQGLSIGSATMQTTSILRYARQTSVTKKAPSVVRLDKSGQGVVMTCLERRTVGLWHFESETDGKTAGAFGHEGRVMGAQLGLGRIGKGYLFQSGDAIDFGGLPFFDGKSGLVIGFWIYPYSMQEQILLQCGDTFRVRMLSGGGLEAIVGDLTVVTDGPGARGSLKIPTDHWTHIEITFDERNLVIWADGRAVDFAQGNNVTYVPSGSFVLGDPRQGFSGILDEVLIAQLVHRQSYALPGHITIETNDVDEIRFSASGRLDPLRHRADVTWRVVGGTDHRDVEVTRAGMVRIRRSVDAPAPAIPESVMENQ